MPRETKITLSSFREAQTYFCPRGCNVFTTTEQSPECGACGSIMSSDSTSFDDVHEEVERRGIAAVVREAGKPRP